MNSRTAAKLILDKLVLPRVHLWNAAAFDLPRARLWFNGGRKEGEGGKGQKSDFRPLTPREGGEKGERRKPPSFSPLLSLLLLPWLVWKTAAAAEEEVAIQEREKEQRRHFSYIILYFFGRSIDSLCGCVGENLKEIQFFPKGKVAKFNFAIVWIFYALWYECVAAYDCFLTAHLDPFPSKKHFYHTWPHFQNYRRHLCWFPRKRSCEIPTGPKHFRKQKAKKKYKHATHGGLAHFSQGKNMKGENKSRTGSKTRGGEEKKYGFPSPLIFPYSRPPIMPLYCANVLLRWPKTKKDALAINAFFVGQPALSQKNCSVYKNANRRLKISKQIYLQGNIVISLSYTWERAKNTLVFLVRRILNQIAAFSFRRKGTREKIEKSPSLLPFSSSSLSFPHPCPPQSFSRKEGAKPLFFSPLFPGNRKKKRVGGKRTHTTSTLPSLISSS